MAKVKINIEQAMFDYYNAIMDVDGAAVAAAEKHLLDQAMAWGALAAAAQEKMETPAVERLDAAEKTVTREAAMNWYKKRGGIDALQDDERSAAEKSYQSWASRSENAANARKYDLSDYVDFRQRAYSQGVERKRQRAPGA